ncbi:hypothetical protein D3C72_1546400 [compost metagenome]
MRGALYENANDQAAYAQTKQLALGITADLRVDALRADVADRTSRMDQVRRQLAPLDKKIETVQKAVDGMSRNLKADNPGAVANLGKKQDELKDLQAQKARLETRILAMKDERRALKDMVEERQANPLEAARRKLGGEDDYYAQQRTGLSEGVSGLAQAFGDRANRLDAGQQRLLAPLGVAVNALEQGVREGSDTKTLLSHAKQLVQALHVAINQTPAPDAVAVLAAGSLVEACEFLVAHDHDRHA